MATRSSSKSRRRAPKKQPSKVSRGLTILRKKGLIGKGEFSNPKSGGARNIVRKYAGVIEGRDTVVTPKTKLIPKRYRKALKERRGKLVVPKVDGTITTTVKTVGRKGNRRLAVTRTRRTSRGNIEHDEVAIPSIEISGLQKGKVYRISGKNWGRSYSRYFANKKTLDEFLAFYDSGREWLDISQSKLPRGFQDDSGYPWFRVLYWKGKKKHRVTFQAVDRAHAVTLFEDVYGDFPIINVTEL